MLVTATLAPRICVERAPEKCSAATTLTGSARAGVAEATTARTVAANRRFASMSVTPGSGFGRQDSRRALEALCYNDANDNTRSPNCDMWQPETSLRAE